MTTPANMNSDARSMFWEMMARAEAEARRRIAAIEANMIWSRIDISENPSEFSEGIVEEREILDDHSEDEYDTDEVLSSDNKVFDDNSDDDEMIGSDNEEFDDDDDNDQVMVSGDEEFGIEEESEEDRYRRQFLELNGFSDSDSE